MKEIWCFLINLAFFTVVNAFSKDIIYDAPPLYNYHDYDWCFRQNNNETIFCIVEAQVQPNISSTVWQVISSFNKPKQQFRHDHLQYGLCKSECLNIFSNYYEKNLDNILYEGKLISSDMV